MDDHQILLMEIEAFLPLRGIKETTFGRMAVEDGKFVRRLRDGRTTFRTVKKAREFIAAELARMASTPQSGAAA